MCPAKLSMCGELSIQHVHFLSFLFRQNMQEWKFKVSLLCPNNRRREYPPGRPGLHASSIQLDPNLDLLLRAGPLDPEPGLYGALSKCPGSAPLHMVGQLGSTTRSLILHAFPACSQVTASVLGSGEPLMSKAEEMPIKISLCTNNSMHSLNS